MALLLSLGGSDSGAVDGDGEPEGDVDRVRLDEADGAALTVGEDEGVAAEVRLEVGVQDDVSRPEVDGEGVEAGDALAVGVGDRVTLPEDKLVEEPVCEDVALCESVAVALGDWLAEDEGVGELVLDLLALAVNEGVRLMLGVTLCDNVCDAEGDSDDVCEQVCDALAVRVVLLVPVALVVAVTVADLDPEAVGVLVRVGVCAGSGGMPHGSHRQGSE